MSTSKEEDKKLSPLKRALIAVKDMRDKLEAAEGTAREPIAIVGMACRFPGFGYNLDAYWRLLEGGVDAISEVPTARWDVKAFYDPNPETPGKMYMREGGFLDETDKFDAGFFGITPREAALMDPQQRLLLEVGWEALEHAAIAPERIKNSLTGVFVGISVSEYMQLGLRQGGPDQIDAYSGTGGALSVAAGRLSYFLRLRGPAISIDTACSSSLVAMDQAVLYLRSKKCDLALAGGVNFMLSPESTIYLCKVKALSQDGRCKAFDISADGYGRGEGCGIIVLKRLSDALTDGDRILAVIRGSAVNHDGRSSGLTVPNGAAQQEVIRAAQANAELDPSQIDYIEAHGTGTALGDPIEIRALDAVFGKKGELLVGTAKTNIGHLESAAGVAGVIKVVLALQNGMIPPHLHLKNPSPHIPWDEISIRVPTELTAWPAGVERPIAGVSSFGFSGTNAHVILQAAPDVDAKRSEVERPLHVLSLSAQSQDALTDLAVRYENHLISDASYSPADVCFTSGVGRSHFTQRLAVVSDSSAQAQLAERLSAFNRGEDVVGVFRGQAPEGGRRPKVAFLFTGQGSQYVGMGRELYDTQLTFRRALDECDELLQEYLQQSLVSALYPGSGGEAEAEEQLTQTVFTQPALFALEYALAQLWRSWGVEPSAVMGHSVGEYVAACVAGVFSLQDGLRLIAERGRLMGALPAGGVMAAVFADEGRVAAAIASYRDTVSIAAINGPESVVISGAGSEVEMILKQLESEGIRFTPLNVSHAFHSPLMEPMLAEFEKSGKGITFSKPQIKLISNLTAEAAKADEVTQAGWWCRHVRQPVRFAESMRTLNEQGFQLFLEVGPQPVLLGMGRQCVSDEAVVWLPSLRRGRSDWQQMLESLSALYTHGAAVDWAGFDRDYVRRKVSLPTYPFQRKRYWIDGKSSIDAEKIKPSPSARSEILNRLYEIAWAPKPLNGNSAKVNQVPDKDWIIFADGKGVASSLSEIIKENGENCKLIFSGDSFRQLDKWQFTINPDRQKDFRHLFENHIDLHKNGKIEIVYLWPLDTQDGRDGLSAAALEKAQRFLCGSVLHLLQALDTTGFLKPAHLWIITRGVQATEAAEYSNIMQSPLWGLGRTLMQEHPGLLKGLIDLDTDESAGVSQRLFHEVKSNEGETQVRYSSGERQVVRLNRVAEYSSEDDLLQPEETYLVTGGLGALGFLVARWLVRRGARHLCLIGRSGPTDRARRNILHLEELGCKVAFKQCDVSREAEVNKVIGEIRESMPPLRGVIHAAGVLDDGILLNQSWQRFEKVMAPKISGAWNLHLATQDNNLRFFVLFSSAASVFGAAGQGNYAAANAFLDTLAGYRQHIGLPGVAIAWGPWSDAGMAADRGEKREQRLRERGLGMISPDEALRILGALMNYPKSLVAVLKADWDTFLAQYSSATVPPLFSELSKETQAESIAESVKDELGQWKRLKPEKRASFLESYLRKRIAGIIGLETGSISVESEFAELGIDSLMIMEIINYIRRDFGLSLYVKEAFERPSVRLLAKYIDSELDREKELEVASQPFDKTTKSTLHFTKAPRKDPSLLSEKLKAPMVFLLSSPRSGSTLLRVMLAGHSQLFCPPELHLLPFNSLAERRDLLGQSYLTEGLERALMELKGLTADESRTLLDELMQSGANVQQVYHLIQDDAAPRLLLDKSPTYAFDIETLEWAEHLFERPKYIHLVRHPYSVIESFVRNRMERLVGIETEDPSQLAEQVWCETNANIIDFSEEIDSSRHHRVYYEDLVQNSEQVIRGLCSFLEVPFEEALLKPYDGNRMAEGLHTRSVGIGDPNFLNHDSIDASLADSWGKVTLGRRLSGFSRRVARELNYDLPEEATVVKDPIQIKAQPSQLPALEPVSREKEIPLSYQQERLWFLMQLEPENVAYNLPGLIFRLQGILDENALRESLDEIIRRHEIFRTTFHEVDGKPVQVVLPHSSIAFKNIDLSNEPANLREEKAHNLIGEELKKQLDLKTGPLIRAILIDLKADDHILSVPIHHIISDGWSFGVFLRELSDLYKSFISGQASPLPDLPIQYADYCHWQREWLQGEVLERQLGYWKQKLSGDLPVLQLPTDRSRPAFQTYRGAKEAFVLPKHLREGLNKLSRSNGVTLFMTLLAAFKTLLYRYTGQVDFVVGSPIANRNRAEIEGLIGFFVNTLVLRTDLSGDPRFLDLLKQIREVTLDAYDHQDMPFEKLVEALRPSRNISYSPLFQVMFVFQNVPRTSLTLPALTLTPMAIDAGTSMVDLTLFTWESEEGLAGKFEYNTDLFDAGTIARMVDHFKTLLESIVTDPTQRLSELTLLTERDRHQLLEEWNATHKDYPKDKTLVHLFEEQVERSAEAVALVFEDEQLTYSELNARANQLAYHLMSLGVGPEVIVGLYMERSLEMVIGIYGILKAGGAYVPLDPEYPPERIAFMVEDTVVSVLLTQENLVASLPEQTAKVICLDSDWDIIAAGSTKNPAAKAAPENLAYVIYTSGSTGRPKGVMNEHRGIVNRLIWMQDEYQLIPDDRVLQKTPFSFDVSVWEFFWPLQLGASLIVAQPGGHRDSAYLIKLIIEQRITTLHFVPSMLQIFLEEDGVEKCKEIKRVICSGEALSIEVQNRFFERLDTELHNLYGPTEAAVDVTYWACRPDSERKIVPIGFPVANTQMYVLDPKLRPVPIGCTGELHIGGVQVARGYLNRAELTAEKFIPDQFSNDSDARLYKTGDLARFLSDGSIEYSGRIDFQVKIRGLRVELGEIEAQLEEVAAIKKCVVLVREDRPGDQRLVAYYVASSGDDVSISYLRKYLQSKLPDYMVPQHFVELALIPVTSNGKVDRNALPRPQAEKLTEALDAAPRTPMEKLIAEIWEELLVVERVGIHDNFFDLGGHSLLSMRVVARLEKAIGLRINPRELIYQTVEQLASDCEKSTIFSKQQVALKREISKEFREPFYFGPQEKPLFGCYHLPQAEIGRECGIVLCYPMGNEYIKSHRTYLQLAVRLCKIGFPVIRFEYYGTGDSAGDCNEGNLKQWIFDISTAIDEIKQRSGLSKVSLVGLRLGGALSMMVCSERSDIDSLILLNPIVTGKAYIEEMNILQKEMLRRSYVKPERQKKEEDLNEILGFPLTDFMVADLKKIDLRTVRHQPVNHILLIQDDKDAYIESLKEHLMRTGNHLEYRQLSNPKFWLEEPHKVVVPHQLLNSVVSWISEVY